MWQRLLRRFEPTPEEDGGYRRRLACAVLLLECARADFARSDAEIDVVRGALTNYFGLSVEDADALMQQAAMRAEQAVSLHEYVSRLNAELQPADKREIMAMLWRVAYADGHLDAHEEHLLRKLADLLFVPQQDYIRTKLDAAGEQDG